MPSSSHKLRETSNEHRKTIPYIGTLKVRTDLSLNDDGELLSGSYDSDFF
jgi:hypothetical protein